MVYRLILNENVEHEVFHRLDNYGHDVEHVDFVPELGKGTATIFLQGGNPGLQAGWESDNAHNNHALVLGLNADRHP